MRGGGTSTSQNQTGSSNTNYSGQTYSQSTLPDWVNQAGPQLYGAAANEVDNFNPHNALNNQTYGLAGYMQGMSPYAMEAAGSLYGSDRGGGYAEQAIQQLLRGGGPSGSSQFGAGGRPGGGGGEGVRDVSWRDFGSFNMGDYMSPYTNDVVNNSLSDLDRASQIEGLRRGDAAMRSGAFGGSRHGVADALAQGEHERAAGSLSAQLRDQAFTRASDLIGRDQAGGLQAGMANQGGDIAELNAATSRYGADAAAGSSMYGNQIQGLVAAMNGGLGLGGLDVQRGNAWQGLGESTFGIGRQAGLDRTQLDQSRFGMMGGLANMLAGIPTERGQFGQASGTSTTNSTMSSRGREQENPGTSDYLGLMMTLFGMGGGG